MAATMIPGRRGEFSCQCTGHVEETKGRYGWIIPYSEIAHPDIWRHQGRIYLDPSDICPGTLLRAGDTVVFYLYSDQDGLGAEDCRLAPSQPQRQESEIGAGVHASVLAFLNADYDDSDDEEEPILELNGKAAAAKKGQDAGDSDSTTCGSRSTQSSPGEVTVDFDGSHEEESDELQDELQAELRAARAAAAGLAAEKAEDVQQHDDLQAELRAARAQAQHLEESSQRDSLQSELRAARAEAGRLAADLQKENLQVELREARAQAGQLAAKLEAVGLNALEMAAQSSPVKEVMPESKYADLPSKGSVLHASGQCRRCNFFAKGCCSKGKDCCFCHFPHDKQDSRKAAQNQHSQNGTTGKKIESQPASKASKRQPAVNVSAPLVGGKAFPPPPSKACPPPPGLVKVVGPPPGLECLGPIAELSCVPCGTASAEETHPFETELQAELRMAREQALRLAKGIQ